MRYSLEQLETFAAVANAGSFSAAARRLGKTQSTVSTAIANLEIDLGVELFDRTSRIPGLTDAGRKLLRETELILERCLALDAHANALGEDVERKLTLAIEVPHNTLMAPLTDFAEAFPYVDLDIRHPVHGDVTTLVGDGTADFGIGFAKPRYSRDFSFTQMGKLTLIHVVSREHPLAQVERVDFGVLRQHRRLIFSAHGETLPSTEYLEATRVWQADSFLALLEMMRAGLGWTTLPRQMIRHGLERGEFVELQLSAYPHTDWHVGVDLVWAKAHVMGPACNWLMRRMAQHKVFELDRNGNPTTL
ncbi:LysR family transcriptional regulator [Pandoraea sp. NPDC090278]|uniref:LysR family transcriptional regulator n=1 Tax=Pandoraea sp. NPDC090278 TaxID=3364391 RepID=UPI00383A45C0